MKSGFVRNKRFWLVVALIGVPTAVYAWSVLRSKPAPDLAIATAAIEDIENTVIASGTLEASRMVSVGAQVSGQIKSLKVKLGDRVKAGDAIAEIDATMQENELRNTQAALASVQAQRNVQAASLKQAQLAFERQKNMLAEEATSRADYENAEATLTSTRAQIEALDAQIEQSAATADTAKANLGYTKIKAPMDGTVVALVAKEGQTVNAIQSAPTIVKLAKLDVITVSAEISEADVIRVKPGQKVYFTVLGNPDKRYYGKLRTIEPAPASIETESGGASSGSSGSSNAVYYNALFEVPNPEGELRISMTAQVYVVLDEARHVITVPASALGEKGRDGSHVVLVLDKDGKPVPRQVNIGINNNATAQVLSGLSPGERVVVGQALQESAATSQRRRRPMMF